MGRGRCGQGAGGRRLPVGGAWRGGSGLRGGVSRFPPERGGLAAGRARGLLRGGREGSHGCGGQQVLPEGESILGAGDEEE